MESYKNEQKLMEDIMHRDSPEFLIGRTGEKRARFLQDMSERYPDFVGEGYTKTQVEEFCNQFGCKISRVNEQADNTKAPGTVLSQSRPAGSEVVSGADLEITVSKLEEEKLEPLPSTDTSTGGTTN